MSTNRPNSMKLQGRRRDVVGESDELRKEDVLDQIYYATLAQYLVPTTPEHLECAEFLAQFRRRYSRTEDLGQGEGNKTIDLEDGNYRRAVDTTRLGLLKRQLAVVEFRVIRRLFQSNIAHLISTEAPVENQEREGGGTIPEARQRWDQALQTLAIELLDRYGHADRNEDADLVEKRLGAHARATRHEILDSDGLHTVEFSALMVPLLSHLHQSCRRRPDLDGEREGALEAKATVRQNGVGVNWPVSSINRSLLRNWQQLLEQAGLEHSPLNCYPYVRFEPLETESKMLMVCVTPLDKSFVDPRVEDSHRIAGITLAVFDIGHAGVDIDPDDLAELAVLIRLNLSRLNNTIGCFRSQQALEASAGEATEISRFWYGTGVDRLLSARRKDGTLDDEETLDLWDRFVSELLCATIPGVKTVETFPFDRAYLFEATGASEQSWLTDGLRVRILEAGLKSNSPEDRGGILTALERGDRELSDFEVTQKSIDDDDRNEFWIKYDEKKRKLLLVAHEEGLDNTEDAIEIESAPLGNTEARTIGQKLRTLIGFVHPDYGVDDTGTEEERDENEKRRDLSRGVWPFFVEEGLAYDFQHGMELKQEIRLLFNLQKAYFKHIENRARRNRRRKLVKSIEAFRESLEGKRTKVVYASFDPTLHPENQVGIGDNAKLYLSERHRFTLMLVADDDLEKSQTELDAEKQDLKLLIRLVIRQMLRERVLIATEVDNTIRVARAALKGFEHRLKNIDLPENTKPQVLGLAESVNKLLDIDAGKDLPETTFESEGISFLRFALPPKTKMSKDDKTRFEDEPKIDRESIEAKLTALASEDLRRATGDHVTPIIRVLDSSLPQFKAELPRGIIAECFSVVLKNAAQAAADPKVPDKHEVIIEVQASPAMNAKDPNAWLVYIVVENTTVPIPADRFDKLNSETPQLQDRYAQKDSLGGSHGYGVYTARQQLRRFLGRGADIRYVPVGSDRLQARITLPVTLNTEGKVISRRGGDAAGEVELPDSPVGRHVLYVEDDPSIVEKTMPFLESVLEPMGIAVVRAATRVQAINSLGRGSPLLMISDMTIPYEDVHGNADRKEGALLIEKFIAMHASAEHPPPVWIVSGEDVDDIQDTIANDDDRGSPGYRWADLSSAGSALAAPGLIHIPGADAPDTRTKFLNQAEERLRLTEALQALDTHQPKPVEETEVMICVRHAELSQKNLNDEVKGYLDRYRGQSSPDELLVIDTNPSTFKDLRQDLGVWFSLPPQHELLYQEGERPRPLYNSDFHKTIFCMLRLPDKHNQRLTPTMRYWGLRHNLLFLPEKVTPEQAAQLWSRLYRGRDGVLRHIRHQWYSLQAVDGAKKHYNSVLKKVNSILDSSFTWEGKTEKALVKALANHDDPEQYLKQLAAIVTPTSCEANLKVHKSLYRELNELEKSLLTFGQEPEASEDMRQDRGVKLAGMLRALNEAMKVEGVSK